MTDTTNKKPENPAVFPFLQANEAGYGEIVLSINGNKQFFPFTPGISLRDHFAGQAMQSLVNLDCCTSWEDCAERAYKVADAMLSERAKEVTNE